MTKPRRIPPKPGGPIAWNPRYRVSSSRWAKPSTERRF